MDETEPESSVAVGSDHEIAMVVIVAEGISRMMSSGHPLITGLTVSPLPFTVNQKDQGKYGTNEDRNIYGK